MAAHPEAPIAANALAALPSMLALEDIERRWRRVLGEVRLTDEQIGALLSLDPLAVVRGLREANAPIFDSPATTTVRGLVARLGPAMALRLLEVGPISSSGTSRLRAFWRHAIATAIAAADLARSTGLVDPEFAQVLGLLHDLPAWLAEITARAPANAITVAAHERIQTWNLPPALLDPLQRFWRERPAAGGAPTGTTELIAAAERLAELADHGHPTDDGSRELGDEPQPSVSALLAAHRLRRKVEGALRSFGLDPSIPETEIEDLAPLRHGWSQRRSDIASVMLAIYGCSKSESYRGIVTALTAAALRYGNYDRAFFARFHPGSGRVVLRSKADATSRRLRGMTILASPEERDRLRAALEAEAPVLLPRQPADPLLSALAADELLAVPLNQEFAIPGFLLLDRAPTLRRPDSEADIALAATLGMTGSLLIENLLLRRRRQRAQSSALTDPLTRLHNRRLGLVQLEQEIARARRSTRPLTVLMCDLDHFKQLNDRLGHLQGDFALRETAKVLRDTVRKGDTVCRYGGEEFLIVLPETNPEDALVLATRLFTNVHARGVEVGLPISISVGLTAYRPGDHAEAMLARADQALYASKGSGRNGFSADIEPAGSEPDLLLLPPTLPT
ncbi:MAG: GGDEF domain-containing protein [Planctomycetes bacterium]|nr:GGDEF domain-containing protein [Planctomycetota bacterium]